MDDTVKTGIMGLDNALKGGLRRGASVLITGSPGTGKTIMALQFIYNGIKDYKENGIFITTEENLDDIRYYAKTLGMDIQKYEKSGNIVLIEKSVTRLKGGIVSIEGLLDLIKKKNIKRVSLDSLIFFEYLYPKVDHDGMEFRRQVLLFMQQMKKVGVAFLCTSERHITDLDRIEYDMMDFLFEGFIIVTRVRKGAYFERILTIAKMRGQEHSLDVYPVSIGKGGVSVLTDQVPFSLVEKEEKEKIK